MKTQKTRSNSRASTGRLFNDDWKYIKKIADKRGINMSRMFAYIIEKYIDHCNNRAK